MNDEKLAKFEMREKIRELSLAEAEAEAAAQKNRNQQQARMKTSFCEKCLAESPVAHLPGDRLLCISCLNERMNKVGA